MLTQAELKELLHYDPNTGEFRWRKNNKVAGTIDRRYRRICLKKGVSIFAHRLAWIYMYGTDPGPTIDHINGIRDDNRISNLRQATKQEQAQNRGPNPNNKSGYTGVSFQADRNKWKSQIGHQKKTVCLGYYNTAEEAYQAYLDAKAKYHTFNPVPR